MNDQAVEADGKPRWLRLAPFALVIAACVFNLVILRSETTPANNLNDSAFHLEMVRWADHQIGEGKIPLDGWFPNLSLGSSFFHHYQSLPYTLTAYAARITGLGDTTTYLWILYLFLALWPISVFLGARLLSLERWPAAAAALVSPLIVSVTGYGYEHGSYTWQGFGIFTQLWGMWLLPIVWGLTWRAVTKGGKWYAPAALSLALLIAVHLMTGYLAVLCVGVWVLLTWGREIVRRIGRAAIVTVGSLAIAAWVLVPLVADRNFAAQTAFYKTGTSGAYFDDSYGARKILKWLFTGELFDHGRFPIFTLLVGVGFVLCAIRARRSDAERAVLGVGIFSLLLFFGRATWGSLMNVLPGNGDLQMHRFMAGVDMAAIFMAGIAVVAVAGWVALAVKRGLGLMSASAARPIFVWTAVVGIIVAVLAPAWTERASYDLRDDSYIPSQRAYEASAAGRGFAALVKEAEKRGDGRIYAGTRGNWGQDYDIGSVPAYAEVENYDADSIGYPFRTVQSLSTDIDASFNEFVPAQYEIMNLKYMILPSGHQLPVQAKLLDSQGGNDLYEVESSGYFQVIDVVGSVAANRTDLAAQTSAFRLSALALQNQYPSIAFNGADAAPPTLTGTAPPVGPPGDVVNTDLDTVDGSFKATVHANRAAAVLLKESYDPRWSVTVDGVKAKPVMIAPSLVGVEVSAGTHTIAFKYKPYPDYPVLFLIGLATLVVLIVVPRRKAIRARFGGARSTGEPADANA